MISLSSAWCTLPSTKNTLPARTPSLIFSTPVRRSGSIRPRICENCSVPKRPANRLCAESVGTGVPVSGVATRYTPLAVGTSAGWMPEPGMPRAVQRRRASWHGPRIRFDHVVVDGRGYDGAGLGLFVGRDQAAHAAQEFLCGTGQGLPGVARCLGPDAFESEGGQGMARHNLAASGTGTARQRYCATSGRRGRRRRRRVLGWSGRAPRNRRSRCADIPTRRRCAARSAACSRLCPKLNRVSPVWCCCGKTAGHSPRLRPGYPSSPLRSLHTPVC